MGTSFSHFLKASKICACCKIEKPLSEFGKSAGNKDGHDYYCKDCKSKIQRENRLKRLAKEANTLPPPVTSPAPDAASHAPTEHAEEPQQYKLLKDYTPRELILELKNRGYKGRLVWQPPMPQPIVINLEEFN